VIWLSALYPCDAIDQIRSPFGRLEFVSFGIDRRRSEITKVDLFMSNSILRREVREGKAVVYAPAFFPENLHPKNVPGKIFSADRVRIARNPLLINPAGLWKNAGDSDFIGFLPLIHLVQLFGAVLAIAQVGQRDTRW
jgi:hypothetical protein